MMSAAPDRSSEREDYDSSKGRKRKLQKKPPPPHAIERMQLDHLMMKLLSGMLVLRHDDRASEICNGDDETEQVISIKLECPKESPSGGVEEKKKRPSVLSISVSHYGWNPQQAIALEEILTGLERSFRDFSASYQIKGLKAQMIHLNLQWKKSPGGGGGVCNLNLVPGATRQSDCEGSSTRSRITTTAPAPASLATSTSSEKDYGGSEGSTTCITAWVKISGFGWQGDKKKKEEEEEESSSSSTKGILTFPEEVHHLAKTLGDRMAAALNVCNKFAKPTRTSYSASASPTMSHSERSLQITNTIRITRVGGVEGIGKGSSNPTTYLPSSSGEHSISPEDNNKAVHVLGYFDGSDDSQSFRSMVVSEGKPPEAAAAPSAIASMATTSSKVGGAIPSCCYSMNAVAISEEDCCSDDMEGFELLERAAVLSTPQCTCYLLHDFMPVSGLHASDKWISLAETFKRFGDELATMASLVEEEETTTKGSMQQQDPRRRRSKRRSRVHLVLHSSRLACPVPGGLDIHLLSLLVKKATEHLIAEMKREAAVALEGCSKQSASPKEHMRNIVSSMRNIALRSFDVNLLTAISDIPTDLYQ
jgi:hypothetical protein